MEKLPQDIRYALRMMRKNPGFATVAVLTLTLGIGANTAIFSIINKVLLKPLPFEHSEQLVQVRGDFHKLNVRDAGLSVSELFDLRDRTDLFDQISGLYPINANITWVDQPERVEALLVDVNYFSILGVGAQTGRVFRQEDYRPGIAEVAVISDGLWRRRYGSDPNVVGKKFQLDNDLYEVIGVMPPDFHHPGRTIQTEVEVWAPAGWVGPPFGNPVRSSHILQGAIARLKPGVTVASAQSRADELGRQLRQEFPNDYPEKAGWSPRVVGLHEDLVGNVRPVLLVLLVAVALVLLIACTNVANLLLARASARQREIAIRRALGASRARLVRQFITESVLLSLMGGTLGVLMTVWTVDALVKLSPMNIQRLGHIDTNATVLAFTIAISVLTGILFGLVPAIQASNPNLQEALKDTARGTTSGLHRNRMRSLLIVTEFAFALMLLISAALLIRSFWRLQKVDPGFTTDNVLTARLWLPQPNLPETGPYFKHSSRVTLYKEVLLRVAALPGVQAAGGATRLPLDEVRSTNPFTIEGESLESADVNTAQTPLASPGYFEALRIPLIKGRSFTEQEDEKAPGVAVVNQTFAQRYFADQDAIGKRIRLGGRQSQAPWLTIIGVVRDVKSEGLDAESKPQIYRSILQASSLTLALVIRTTSDPAAISEAVRSQVQAVDPDLPVYGIRTMKEVISGALTQRRFTMMLLVVFAIVALVLSSIGIYGVISYSVGQRTHEIGIRMALGAKPRDVLRLIMTQGMVLTLFGVAVGLAGAVAMTRFLAFLLFGVSATDPVTFASITLLLAVVALLACFVPALRALKVDPMIALRHD
jgi:putative ABC transport system permease protein